MKMTVSEYAKELNVSVQTIYKKIKRGVINTVKDNNITYVILDDKEGIKPVKGSVSDNSNDLLTLIKSQQKEIRRLTKKLEKCNGTKEDVLLQYIAELKEVKQLNAPVKAIEGKEEVIEADISPKKKKKFKKSKKKKKS